MTRIPGDPRALMPTGIHAAFKDLRAALERDSTLDIRIRELLRLKAADLAGCRR